MLGISNPGVDLSNVLCNSAVGICCNKMQLPVQVQHALLTRLCAYLWDTFYMQQILHMTQHIMLHQVSLMAPPSRLR